METVERYGVPVVSQLAYAEVQEAREKELRYIAGQLRLLRGRNEDETAIIVDLRAWLENRRTCFSHTSTGKPE